MFTLKTIRKYENFKNESLNNYKSFIDVHRYTESYFKRIYFIGFRKKGLQYKKANELINKRFMNAENYLDNIFKYFSEIDKNKDKLNDFTILADLYKKFTVKYRNNLVHGSIEDLNPDMCKLLIHIDISLITEIERIFEHYYNKTPINNKPNEFGAKRGISRTQDELMDKLDFGKHINKPKSKEDVENLLMKTVLYKNY